MTLVFDTGVLGGLSNLSPTGSFTVGNTTVSVSNFLYTPDDQTGLNRVTNHNVGTSGPEGTFPDSVTHFTMTVSTVPEPGSLALLGLGFAAFRLRRRKPD